MAPADTTKTAQEKRDKLSKGGDPKAQQCGWLKDKYGLSWKQASDEEDQHPRARTGRG